MPFGYPDTFEVKEEVKSNWTSKFPVVWPNEEKQITEAWQTDEALKKLFGIALARCSNPFEAACSVYLNNNQALWASTNLINDPVVVVSKAEYNNQEAETLLDKTALSFKILKFAEEKDPSGRFYIVDAKERLAALALYAKIQGYTSDNVNIDASTVNNDNRTMKIVLVKPEEKHKLIDTKPSSVVIDKPQLPNIKLVSNG